MSAVQIADLISIYIYTSDGVRKYRRTRRAKKKEVVRMRRSIYWDSGGRKARGGKRERKWTADEDGGVWVSGIRVPFAPLPPPRASTRPTTNSVLTREHRDHPRPRTTWNRGTQTSRACDAVQDQLRARSCRSPGGRGGVLSRASQRCCRPCCRRKATSPTMGRSGHSVLASRAQPR